MFDEKIVLAILNEFYTEKILESYRKCYNVVGIITDNPVISGKNEENIYDYNIIDIIVEKIIVIDELWQDDLRIAFDRIFVGHGLTLGLDYIYGSMCGGSEIDTNLLFEMAGRDRAGFYSLIQRVVGNREIVMVHGNCQCRVISKMLNGNKGFREKYITCVMPKIWEVDQKTRIELMKESGVFNIVDYLFTQQISNGNRFGDEYSTESLIALVPETCKVLSISNLFFLGYYPQYKKVRSFNNINFFRGKLLDATEYVDTNILRMIIDDKEDEEIIRDIKRFDYYSGEEILDSIDNELKRFREREKNLDIKMSDYLEENYKKYLLFATSNHPTREVMKEFTRRILRQLDINDREIDCPADEIQEPMPKEWRYLVYPSVLKNLGIERELEYKFKAYFAQGEKKIVEGIEKAEILEEREHGGLTYYEIKCDFEAYMRIYVRCLRAALMLL